MPGKKLSDMLIVEVQTVSNIIVIVCYLYRYQAANEDAHAKRHEAMSYKGPIPEETTRAKASKEPEEDLKPPASTILD